MAKRTVAWEVEVEYPDVLEAREIGGAGGGLRAAAGSEAESLSALFEAVQDSAEFTEVAAIEVGGAIDEGGLGAFRDEAGRDLEEVVVRVPLEAGEGAALLSEYDGVLRWEYPEVVTERQSGGLGAAADVGAVAVFRSRFRAERDTEREAEGLGFAGKLLFKPIRKLVLRFAAKKAAEAVSGYLERNVEEGPMVLRREGEDGFGWSSVASFEGLSDGAGPRKILLFVHGTFSSTVGSFGSLGLPGNEAGRAFLSGALGEYDAVIGFDHKTLAKSVGENARDLLAALETLPAGEVTLDAVAFSRGGLVLRSLTENLLPSEGRRFRLRRAVFVACTNRGTLLAHHDHWGELVDLYTNLVAGAEKVVSLAAGPQAMVGARIVSELLQGVLSFVRYLATEAVVEGAVPGLASMNPAGSEVSAINAARERPPSAGEVDYFIVDADFNHGFFGDGPLADVGLHKRLFLEFADTLVDHLFQRAPNDLVVNRDSMAGIAPWAPPDWIRGRHTFEHSAGVYHTIYFVNPLVAVKLQDWLAA